MKKTYRYVWTEKENISYKMNITDLFLRHEANTRQLFCDLIDVSSTRLIKLEYCLECLWGRVTFAQNCPLESLPFWFIADKHTNMVKWANTLTMEKSLIVKNGRVRNMKMNIYGILTWLNTKILSKHFPWILHGTYQRSLKTRNYTVKIIPNLWKFHNELGQYNIYFYNADKNSNKIIYSLIMLNNFKFVFNFIERAVYEKQIAHTINYKNWNYFIEIWWHFQAWV